jgi:hypothetical protein
MVWKLIVLFSLLTVKEPRYSEKYLNSQPPLYLHVGLAPPKIIIIINDLSTLLDIEMSSEGLASVTEALQRASDVVLR